MIAIENIIHGDKALLTVTFDAKVLKHLKCKCDDYLVVLQSKFNPSYFLIAKSDTGYRIKRNSTMKKTYQVNVGFRFPYLSEFSLKECTFFLRKNNTIRIMLTNV
jgi:hypothetical protein